MSSMQGMGQNRDEGRQISEKPNQEAVMHNSLWKNSIIKLKQKNYEENF